MRLLTKMHPFFRYGLGNNSPQGHGSHSRRESPSRTRSPTESYDEEDEELEEGKGNTTRKTSVPLSPPRYPTAASERTPERKAPTAPSIPVIKVEDEVVYMAQNTGSKGKTSNENRKRLGPNKNNIILETLQRELEGGK